MRVLGTIISDSSVLCKSLGNSSGSDKKRVLEIYRAAIYSSSKEIRQMMLSKMCYPCVFCPIYTSFLYFRGIWTLSQEERLWALICLQGTWSGKKGQK